MQYFYSFNKLKEKEKNKGWKGVASKPYEPVLYITVMGKGVEFGASWVEDVDRVYMHLNLSELGGSRDES
ncbi:unnamed protein product [Malus baccata var. baccata]